MSMTQLLAGHTSQDTAFLVEDYPYGFRLRCQIRYWLEYREGHGFRFMSQTTNPKRPGVVWNKPKASTYSALAVMFLDEHGHVHHDGLHTFCGLPALETFYAAYQGEAWDDLQQVVYAALCRFEQAYAARKQAQRDQAARAQEVGLL